MMWFQVAFDHLAPHGKKWVVLSVYCHGCLGRDLGIREHSRWPTRHEAEGHARKTWEKVAG